MNKSELVSTLAADHPHLPQRQIGKAVKTVFEHIGGALAEGRRVELRGFGAFTTRSHQARTGRNPFKGAAVEIDAKLVLQFKPGKEMRQPLNANRRTRTVNASTLRLRQSLSRP
jgi:integration host factor subunit beta